MDDKIIGRVELRESSLLIFSVCELQWRRYARVFTFVRTHGFENRTKQGFVLNKSLLRRLIGVLSDLERIVPTPDEKEFKRIARSDVEFLRIGTVPAQDERELPAVDIEEFIGPTKRGIRFRWDLLPDVLARFREQAKAMEEGDRNEPSPFTPEPLGPEEEPGETTERLWSPAKALGDLIGEPLKRFPRDFLGGAALKGKPFRPPEGPLRLEEDNTGAFVLKTGEGLFAKIRNPAEGNFVIYAQMQGLSNFRLPAEMLQTFKAVKAYENYVRAVRAKVHFILLKHSRQESVADYETEKLLRLAGLPRLET